ncbi:DUF393 domain-containing protein [Photobacterium japonica]|uniref:thiol-disulfide oxidoreductase DCC family protein n=1 Tax=Photobacterium japonica TaxID=2910235 RepID=UPI003D0A74F2
MTLTIFYDGRCPLCVAEMQQLQRADHQGRLQFEEIGQPDFTQRFPTICPEKASTILHGVREDGVLLLGLDVTALAWRSVGQKRWIQMLRWPLIRGVADVCYRIFAKHRYRFSAWLMGQAQCEACSLPRTADNTRTCALTKSKTENTE